MIVKAKDMEKAAPLFLGWQETMIWSCQQGIMGEIYVDDSDHPTAAMAILADFCFFSGKPQRELLAYKPKWCTQDFIIMVPQSPVWGQLIEECFGERAKKVTRYAFKKEPEVFDLEGLAVAAGTLPKDVTLQLIDEALFHKCRQMDWSSDFVAQYDDYARYQACGLGVVAIKDGELIAGASAYTAYREGIEVEIDTKQEYRRQGLAYACGARLILECRKRGRYPSWDAQNLWSVALAKKLGYHYDHAYDAYEIWGY